MKNKDKKKNYKYWKKFKLFLKKYKVQILKKYGSQLFITVGMIISVLITRVANFLFDILKNIIENDLPPYIMAILSFIFIVATIFVLFIVARLENYLEKHILPEAWDDRYMKSAFLHLRRLGANKQESLYNSFHCFNSFSKNSQMVEELGRCMQLTVKCCYEFFLNSFSDPNKLVEDISFEVTFMTKSYKDGYITIPYSANKENRTPISMLQRNQNTYDNTETAKIYKMIQPKMILIENTADEENHYEEIYENQKDRIRSSVILPVLSHRNELLGTLVVHCDQAGFFKSSRSDFWKELLEMFSVEIGYCKLMMDYYINEDNNLEKPF